LFFLLNLSSLPPRGESKGRSHPAGVLLCALCTQQGAAQFMPWTKRFDDLQWIIDAVWPRARANMANKREDSTIQTEREIFII